jgi:uncharacterized protein (TIGR02145 family)
MKTLNLISLFSLALLFSHCGTTESTPSTNNASVAEGEVLLRSAQQKFLEYADSTGGNPRKAIEMTVNYLYFEPNVEDVYSIDSTYIRITLKSGLQVSFMFAETDAAGNYLYRGGGGGESFSQFSPLANNTITNKKVLFFAADTKTLPAINPQIEKSVEKMNSSGLDLEITILRDEQCNYGVVETFGDYGLVLIDTHGESNGFRVGSILDFSAISSVNEGAVQAAINSQLTAGAYEKIREGKLMLVAEVKGDPNNPSWHKSSIPQDERSILFTTKFVNALPKMPNTIILGNMCYSGTTTDKLVMPAKTYVSKDGKIIKRPERTQPIDGIGSALINRDLISYYAYTRDQPFPGTSRAVPDEFAASCENSLVIRLISENDSTGIAHTSHVLNEEFYDPEQQSLPGNLYFRQFGHKDYSYQGCVKEFTDERDGQKYKAVCIGKQNWMAENLRYVAPGSECYDSTASNCTTFGRLYPWRAAMAGSASSNTIPSGVQGICPKGWHLPSAAEWEELFTFLGGKNVAGNKMKLKSPLWKSFSGEDNSSGFTGIPGGLFTWNWDIPNGDFKHHSKKGEIALFLSSTLIDGKAQGFSLQHMSQTIVPFNSSLNEKDPYQPSLNASCRCVKD